MKQEREKKAERELKKTWNEEVWIASSTDDNMRKK